MEKKSTRIAYFVALGVFIVLLVILGISFKDTPLPTFVYEDETVTAATPFAATFWSLLPPIVAIVLALISKEVYSSPCSSAAWSAHCSTPSLPLGRRFRRWSAMSTV